MARRNNSDDRPRKTGVGMRVARILTLLFDILVVVVMIVTAYAGNVSPMQHGGYWGVLPLLFPFVLIVCVLALVLELLWYRRGSLLLAVSLLICGGPVLTAFPVHVSTPKVPEGAESFTLLTYNVHNFVRPGTSTNADTTYNAQLDYVIHSDADIVLLQEATYLGRLRKGFLTGEQIDEMHGVYPHIHIDGTELAILSKYPIESIHLDATSEKFQGGHITCYRVTLPSQRLVTVFNVHLESMKLREDDRELYERIAGLRRTDRQEIREVKTQLYDKLALAAVNRARQAQQMLRYIRLYGGPDVIVAGDFNDVPGCYTIHTLADAGFRSVYPEVGFGPLISFADRSMYFCLDHTLYRGALTPVEMKRGDCRASDHYPLLTKFYLK